MKYTSIPRLELAAAILSTNISGLVKRELGFDDTSEYYWTDSQVVIGYLRNTQKRFEVFVAKRVQQIKESSDVLQWHYIPSKMNPADYASRGHMFGLMAQNFCGSQNFNGQSKHPHKRFKLMILKLEQKSRLM